MLNAKELKAEMVRNGYTQKTLAAEIGITTRTFSTRMRTGDFGAKEIETMIDVLHLKEPMRIFFLQNQ